MAGLQHAIAAAGSARALARALGIRGQAITQWKRKGIVPPARVIEVERITGVHRHLLNPALYPEPPDAARADER